MVEVEEWLASLGLSEYAPCFAAHHIDAAVLPDLSDQDLEMIGVGSLGHRRRLLRAISELPLPIASGDGSPQSRHDRAERRQLTLLFCDLVGSTPLSVRLDPEELREIINCYHQACAEAIAECGGFVARYMGDGILAYFGYPYAHEDDAERAVRAGLRLVEVIAKIDGAGTRLQARIGIATGVVVVGDILRGRATKEESVVGEAPNLAARLQGLAEPGTIVIDASTRRLVGKLFDYRSLGTVSVKGFCDPLAVWQVIGVSGVDSRFEALRAGNTPLVGREEEVDLLMRRWQKAKGGDGAIVLVSGEAGIGKSRIVQTLVERLSDEPHARLRYFCSPHHQDSPLHPVISRYERVAGFRRDDTPAQKLEKLADSLAETADPVGAVALLAPLLSIPATGRYAPPNLTPQKLKERTLQTLLAQVEAIAAKHPVLMVIEDMHWSDPTSQELLDLLVECAPNLPILMVVTFRPGFSPTWLSMAHVTLLSLNRLSRRNQAELITCVADGKALPQEIVGQIMDRTDGVPLFIEELTKTVIESGMLLDAGDRYTLVGSLPPPSIPTTLNASLLARLDRLAPVREVAQIGAVIGRQFSHALLSAVAAMPEDRLEQALAQLVGTELIFRRGSAPDAAYSFKHALVQDAVYSTLLRGRREHLHGLIATTLKERFPEVVEAQPDLLARHCAEAGLLEQAIDYWLKAGRQSIARWALTEAVAQLRKGLELVSRLPGGATRLERELDLQMTLAHALTAAMGYAASEPGEAFIRARHLCEQLDRPPQLARALGGQFAFQLVRADLQQAELHAKEMRDLGTRYNQPKWIAAGAAASGCVCCYLGKFSDSQRYYTDWLSRWDPSYRAVASTPEDYYVQGLTHLYRTLACLGQLDQARARRDEALAEARRLSPYTLAAALCLAWYGDWAMYGRKGVPSIVRAAEEVLALARDQGFPLWLGVGNIMRGWCLGTEGRADEGVPLILSGLSLRRATGSNLLVPFGLMILAQVSGNAGHPQEGLARLAEAETVAAGTKERWADAEILRLKGGLLLTSGDEAGAHDSYRRALAVAQEQGARFWALRAALDLARLHRKQGKKAEARDLLSPVFDTFNEGLDTPYLVEARILLKELA